MIESWIILNCLLRGLGVTAPIERMHWQSNCQMFYSHNNLLISLIWKTIFVPLQPIVTLRVLRCVGFIECLNKRTFLQRITKLFSHHNHLNSEKKDCGESSYTVKGSTGASKTWYSSFFFTPLIKTSPAPKERTTIIPGAKSWAAALLTIKDNDGCSGARTCDFLTNNQSGTGARKSEL